MVFTKEQKIFVITSHFHNATKVDGEWVHNIAPVFEEFQEKFPDANLEYNTFRCGLRNLVDHFAETGSVDRKPGTGKTKTVRTEEKIEEVRQIMAAQPSTSLARIAQQADIAYGTAHKIIRKDLNLFPYRLQVYQELQATDYPRRVTFCNWFNENMNNDILDKSFFSDEAWFHLNGYVNSQNMRLWSTDKPEDFFEERALHPEKVGVYIAISRRRLIGPIFFYDTITADTYRHQLAAPVIEQLDEEELEAGYWQQDAAPAHTARETIRFLEEIFPNRVISKGSGANLWPPRSPDLTPLDFFVFAYLKNTVFKTHVENLQELEQRIIEVCATITPEVLDRVFESMKRRVNLCIQQQGHHFQHLL